GDGRVYDLPPQTRDRYISRNTVSTLRGWRFNQKPRVLPAGCTLRIELLAPARIRWTTDGWRSSTDSDTRPSALGTHYFDVPTAALPAGGSVTFTPYWIDAARWEGTDFTVAVH
ncbi:MAG: glucan 1,4-alpha-glucosidase, partial [Proteobacteria bacterium]|nr:glucan 1,4-alpha-glucosidase [Pseudomonadota bacterium]